MGDGTGDEDVQMVIRVREGDQGCCFLGYGHEGSYFLEAGLD